MGTLLQKTKTRWGEPQELYGLQFSPLTMDVYPLWLSCSGALTLRMSTLPARYAIKCYADALYTMLRERGSMEYIMFKLLMGLSIGIPDDMINKCIVEHGDKDGLKSVIVRYGEYQGALLPKQLDDVRKVIAELNGAELPDESDNAEIMQAEEDLKSAGKRPNLKMDLFDEMASVAAASQMRMEDIRNMTILEYTRLKRAHNRRMLYLICAIAEGSGTKFKGGNPAPNWLFDLTDPNHGLIDLKKWDQEHKEAIKTGAPPGMDKLIPQ